MLDMTKTIQFILLALFLWYGVWTWNHANNPYVGENCDVEYGEGIGGRARITCY